MRSLREGKGVCLMEPGHEYSTSDGNLCALATWSGRGDKLLFYVGACTTAVCSFRLGSGGVSSV